MKIILTGFLAMVLLVAVACATPTATPYPTYTPHPTQLPNIQEVEVTRQVEVTREIIATLEIPVEVTRTVPVTREIEVTRQVTWQVPVTRQVEVTREIPVTRKVPVTREIEVTRQIPVTRIYVATPTPIPPPDIQHFSGTGEQAIIQGCQLRAGQYLITARYRGDYWTLKIYDQNNDYEYWISPDKSNDGEATRLLIVEADRYSDLEPGRCTAQVSNTAGQWSFSLTRIR